MRPSRNPLTRVRNSRRVNGPSLLLKNALMGFQEIDVEVEKSVNLRVVKPAPYWIPAGDLSSLAKNEIDILSETNLTLGPNIDWFNRENIKVISQLKRVKILVPHYWVTPTIKRLLPNNCQVLVWYSGIDTIFWEKKKTNSRLHRVLIYVKNQKDLENLFLAKSYLEHRQISYEVVRYGSYSQSQLKTVLSRVSAAIWIGGTESQGLALLECWAMDVPTLVLKTTSWHSPDGQVYSASSAPYMTEAVGQFSSSSNFRNEDFENFFSKLKDFSPRDSVKDSFNLAKCASSLLKLLEL
jgi:hypothetical protein